MTSDLETRLRRYGETFEQFVDADPDVAVVSPGRVRRSRPRRLAAHRAAPGPALSIVPGEELVRQRVTPRVLTVAAVAACLAVALVVGAWLLVSASHEPSVQTPAGPPKTAPRWMFTPVPQHGRNHQIPVGVSCSDATHCIAPRGYGNGQGGVEALAGGTWSVTPGSNDFVPAGLTGVSCPDATHCVAVGSVGDITTSQTFIETLAGGTWSVTPSPVDGNLFAVSCSDAAHCVAVGNTNDGTGARTLIATLSGGVWSVTPSPNHGFNNILFAVSCSDAAHCVAVGESNDGTTRSRTLIETLSGGSWSVTHSPDRGAHDSVLTGVSCSDAAHCVAVGGFDATALIETLSDGSWSVTRSPNRGMHDSTLTGVSCPDATHCVAVGGFHATASGSGGQTLIETFPASARHRHRS